MQRAFARLSYCAFSLLVVSLGACGGTPPVTQNVTTLPSAHPSATAPAVDLSPVSLPDALVVTIHGAHVSATADILSDWSGIALDAQPLIVEMVGERIAKLVDIDAPADLAVVLEDRGADRSPEPRFALSLAVKNADAAKATLQAEYGLLPIGNNAFEISRAGASRKEGDHDFRVCAFAPAAGGARIVCSRNATTRDIALPYMTRTIPTQKFTSDVHVEAHPGLFRRFVEKERRNFETSASHGMKRDLRAPMESGFADLVDAFLDADSAVLDGNIDKTNGSVDVKIKARSKRAALTRVLIGHPERAEVVPAAYYRLPADSDVAFFVHGLDADQISTPRDQLLQGMDSLLENESVAAPDRKSLLDAARHSAEFLTMPIMYARGVDVSKAMQAMVPQTGDAAKVRAAAEITSGWDVFGIGAAPDKVTGILKEWVASFSRGGVSKWLSHSTAAPVLKQATTPTGLPAGSQHFTLTATHDDNDYGQSVSKKRPPFVMTLHTLVIPDQDRTWVVNALDLATAVTKAKGLLPGAAANTTLAGRAGIDALKTGAINAGGFLTMRGIGMGTPLTWLMESPRHQIGNDPLLGTSSQSQGSTPFVFTYTESAAGDGGGFTFSGRVPRAILQDVLQVGPRIFR